MRRFKYGFTFVTMGFFLISLVGHWVSGWWVYKDESAAHGERPEAGRYVLQMTRDTLENWQSEFLQLVWQVVGLSILLHVGSSQSKEGDERLEAKVDLLLSEIPGGDAARKHLDTKFQRR